MKPHFVAVLFIGQMPEKEVGIAIEHALLREFRDDAFPVQITKPFAYRRLAQQALDCGDENSIVVARNDELLILLGYHGFDIPDINGSNRKAGRHRFKQCYRHLLRIGGQGKNVKPTQHGFRRYMSGKDNTVLYIELMRQLLQPNSFDTRAGDHEPHR